MCIRDRQNIDGLHQKAGSKNVFELHGTTLKNYCTPVSYTHLGYTLLESGYVYGKDFEDAEASLVLENANSTCYIYKNSNTACLLYTSRCV